MIFNSIEYAVFLAVVLVVYYSSTVRIQNILLLVASWFFYGWWDYRFLALLAISTFVDYFCGHAIARSQDSSRRSLLLSISVLTNLSILAFFKYFNFFIDSTAAVLQWLGLEANPILLEIVLPVGISFYTFQTLSYTVDVYRGQIPACRNFIAFALFVSYFPQLVAGPIERASRLLPQLCQVRRVLPRQVTEGAFLILIGLFKKVGVADALAPFVDARFSSPRDFHGADLLFGVYLFAIQIYCDFSGYSNIARGTSKLLGIDLMVNFKQPYFSSSVTEFWRRWHISLSSWLRDYLYIPLGGNRHGTLRTYRNLLLTMLLGGLWHGAAWSFIVWGGLHGFYLAVSKRFSLTAPKLATRHKFVWRSLCVGITFHLVCLAWVFFRAGNFTIAWQYLCGIAEWNDFFKSEQELWFSGRLIILVSMLLLLDFVQTLFNDEFCLFHLPAVVRGIIYATIVVVILALGGLNADVPFIYFQF